MSVLESFSRDVLVAAMGLRLGFPAAGSGAGEGAEALTTTPNRDQLAGRSVSVSVWDERSSK